MDKDNLLVALDVGSSKVAVIAAELSPEGVVKICGIGSARSEGIRNGVVVDIGGAVRSIRAAIDEAERTSGFHIEEAYTICEDHRMRFVNHSGATPVRGPEIAQGDLDSAVTNAKEVPLKDSEQVLKMVIQQYLVDGEGGILNPIGMMGNRLEASVHLICGLPTTATNLLRCVRRSGVEVKHWTVGAWASALAVLTPSERSLGVCLMDFGAFKISGIQIISLGTAVVLMALLTVMLNKTKIGKAVRATSENAETAGLLGINTSRIITFTVMLASALGAAAGVLIGLSFNAIEPTMGTAMGLKGLAVLIMGGLGNVEGAMAGGFILGIAEVFAVAYGSSTYRDAVAFGIIILILFIRPEGLFSKAGKGGRP